MAFSTGDYYGLTAEDYQALSAYTAFANEWADKFTPVADGAYYIFTGDNLDFYDFLESEELEFGLDYFTYILSTNSVHGF